MSQFAFGSGILWGRQLQDANGNALVNPTPVKFGILQDVSLDVSFDTKMLYGSAQFPVAVGRGKGKVSGKAKAAQINGALLNSIVFGQTLNLTSQRANYNDTSAGIAIPATPFTITGGATASATAFAIPNSGTFAKDLGVRNAATGLAMVRVTSAPTAGQYTVNEATGAYVFSSADQVAGVKVQIDYQYTFTPTTGNSSNVLNLTMGYAPSFAIDLSFNYNGKLGTIGLQNCVASKLSLASKQDDFLVPEFDFEAFADASGNVMTHSWSE